MARIQCPNAKGRTDEGGCTCASEDSAFLYELLYDTVWDGCKVHCCSVNCAVLPSAAYVLDQD